MQHTQPKSIVKNELVATYGFKLVVSGLSSKTRQVQQFLSTFESRIETHTAKSMLQFAEAATPKHLHRKPARDGTAYPSLL